MQNLSYHPSSTYFGREGYYGSLTPMQEKALEAVQRFVIDEGIDFSDLALNALSPKLTLLRYLRANKFDIEKTKAKIQANVKWRIEHNVKELVGKSPEEILGCDMESFVAVFPHWQCGFDSEGRPVIYKQYSKSFQCDKLLAMTTFDALKLYHVWEQEACCRLCYEQSLKLGYIVDTISAVVDCHGIGITQVTRDFLAIIKTIAEIDQEQYPETLGKTYIINTIAAFPFVWRGIRAWIDPVTANKIHIFGSSDFDDTLKRDIGVHSLPLTYDGTRPALSPEVHPYASIVFANVDDFCSDNITIMDRMKQITELRVDDSDSVYSKELNGYSSKTAYESGIYAPSIPSASSISSSKFSDAHDVYRNFSHDVTTVHEGWDEEIKFYNEVLGQPEKTGHGKPDSRMFRRCLIPSRLLNLPLAKIKKLNFYTVAFLLLISLTCVGVSSYALSAMYWTSGEVVKLQMWSGVIILCFCCFLSMLNFIGLVGTHTSNSPLLRLYTVCLIFFFVVFIVVGLMSLVIGYGHNYISTEKIDRITADHDDAKKTLKEYNQIIGWVGSWLALLSIAPFIISRVLIKKLNDALREEEKSVLRDMKISQHRSVLLIAQSVSFIVAIAMIGYAGATLNFLFKIGFQYPLFAVYALLYSGITVVLGGTFGIWAAYSSFHIIQRIYHCVVVPGVSFAVLGTAVASVLQMTRVSGEMSDAYEDLNVNHEKYSSDDLETIIQIELLVGAVLGFSTFLYQAVCAYSSIMLYKLLVERSDDPTYGVDSYGGVIPSDEELNRRRGRIKLIGKDKVTIAFSLLTSFLHIYVSGTFVLFATNAKSSSWMLSIWKVMGRYDSRYTNSDAFLVSSSGFMAFVVGPLLLVYVWTIVNSHPTRQVCGIITYSLEIYTYILYFAIAIHNRSIISMDNATLFVLLFLCLNLFRCLFPVWIVYCEVRSVIEKTSSTRYRKLEDVEEGLEEGERITKESVTVHSLDGMSFARQNKEMHVQCDALDITAPKSSSNLLYSKVSPAGGMGMVNLRSRSSRLSSKI